MIRNGLLFFVVGFFSLLAIAAIPPKVATKTDLPMLAEEILTLPEKNRYLVAEKKSDELYPVLIEFSKSEKKSMQTRWKALTLAVHLVGEKSLPEVEQALKAPEWFMRNAGLVALQSIDPEKAKARAKGLMKDKALVVRSAAVEVIGNDLDTSTRDLFWDELEASYNFRQKQGLWVRGQILEKLAAHPEKKEIPLFVKALKDKDLKLHSSAIAALERTTQVKLGKSHEGLSEKRQMWIQWVRSHSSEILN